MARYRAVRYGTVQYGTVRCRTVRWIKINSQKYEDAFSINSDADEHTPQLPLALQIQYGTVSYGTVPYSTTGTVPYRCTRSQVQYLTGTVQYCNGLGFRVGIRV